LSKIGIFGLKKKPSGNPDRRQLVFLNDGLESFEAFPARAHLKGHLHETQILCRTTKFVSYDQICVVRPNLYRTTEFVSYDTNRMASVCVVRPNCASYDSNFVSFDQGCQMFYFQTENPNLDKIWRALEWKTLSYSMTIWNILLPFGIIYGRLVKFVVIWYIFPRFGMFGQRNIWQPCMRPKHCVAQSKICVSCKQAPKDLDIM
jgi:hypothetical protein